MKMNNLEFGPNAQSYIKWNHIDGPMLICKNGTIHWLTIMERLLLYFNLLSVTHLEEKIIRNIS